MRIDLEDFENSTAFAQYDMFGVGLFSVDPEDDGYPLTIGDYTGTAGMYTWLCKINITHNDSLRWVGTPTLVCFSLPL